MCECTNCRTGKCTCRECSDGPGIDFKASHALVAQIRRAIEIAKIHEMRAPIPERERVRLWGSIDVPATADDNREQEIKES